MPTHPSLMQLSRRSLVLGAPVALTAAAWLAGPARGLSLGGAPADRYAAFGQGGAWLNADPLGPEQLRGKVLLVNFWTYTCINSLRTLPYLRAWADKYRDRGLLVVGVHTPEFGFESDVDNVREALVRQDVRYPVVIDNDSRVWRAFGNSGWPGFFFIDAEGRVRRRSLGEGDYDRAERLIQDLLTEAQSRPVVDLIAPVAGHGAQAAPAWDDLGSSETYLGYEKETNFAAETALRRDVVHDYRSPERLPLNRWSLDGAWRAGREFTTLAGPSGAVTARFHARDLHLVLAPPPEGGPVRFRVRLDGAEPGTSHGADTDAQGWGRLEQPRMYQLIRQDRAVADRTFRIEFFGAGARGYAFTFG